MPLLIDIITIFVLLIFIWAIFHYIIDPILITIVVSILAVPIIESSLKYYPEAVQFAEDFEDIVNLGQPLYYFNFDEKTMTYFLSEHK